MTEPNKPVELCKHCNRDPYIIVEFEGKVDAVAVGCCETAIFEQYQTFVEAGLSSRNNAMLSTDEFGDESR